MSAVTSQSATALDPGAVVASLEHCDLNALRLHWRNHLGSSAPAHLPRWLLMRILAYRLQVIAYGDLSADTKRLLGITSGRNRSGKNNRSEHSSATNAVLGTGTDTGAGSTFTTCDASDQAEQSDIASGNCNGKGNAAVPFSPFPQKQRRAFVKRAAVTRDGQELHPGSILSREFNDTIVRVMVGENGQFIFNGKAYGSLSQIAKAVTGTNWNGHRFFGLKKGQP